MALGWKDDKLRLVNQVRLLLKVYFLPNLLLPRTNRIKRCYRNEDPDDSSDISFQWPSVYPNKESMDLWISVINNLISPDSTLNKSIRFTSLSAANRKKSSVINDARKVIRITVSKCHERYFTTISSRSSQQFRRFESVEDFQPSEETHVLACGCHYSGKLHTLVIRNVLNVPSMDHNTISPFIQIWRCCIQFVHKYSLRGSYSQ